MKIRTATIEDAEPLTALSFQTFYDTFHSHPKNVPEDVADYMTRAFNSSTITAELNEKDSIFLIAEIEDKMAGYAKVMFGSIEAGIVAELPVELNRLYVRQEYLGKGIGPRLMEECLRLARENKSDVIWLGVWEHNLRAISFYEKYGFRAVSSHIFMLGSDPQTDILMQKEIEH